jgi:hypothetical protein
MSNWSAKQARKAEFAMNKLLDTGGDAIDTEAVAASAVRDAAMGKGEETIFEKKLTKEEKKAQAKAKRDAKKKEKVGRNMTARTGQSYISGIFRMWRVVCCG